MNQSLWASLDDVAPHLPFSSYLFLAGIGALYFLIQHIVLHILLRMFYPGYQKLNTHDFHEYRIKINSIVHATLATVFSVYCMFYTCPEGKTFLNDESCRLTCRNSHLWTCTFSASYLLVDSAFLLVFQGIEMPIDKQSLVHHVSAFINCYIAYW